MNPSDSNSSFSPLSCLFSFSNSNFCFSISSLCFSISVFCLLTSYSVFNVSRIATKALTFPAMPSFIIAIFRADSRVQSTPNSFNNGSHSGLSIFAVNKAFKVFRKFAFFRLASPDALPPFEPNFLASSSLRLSKGIKFSCPLLPCPHLAIYKKRTRCMGYPHIWLYGSRWVDYNMV